jgi:hypothetical protein
MRVYTEKYWYDIEEFDNKLKYDHFYIQEIEDNMNNRHYFILRKIVKNYSHDILYDYIDDYDYYPISNDMQLRYYKIIDSNNLFLFQKRNRKRKFNRILDEK